MSQDPQQPADPTADRPADQSADQSERPTDLAGAVDPLVEVRAALEDVLELPLPERAEVFEQAHRVVVAELRALELG